MSMYKYVKDLWKKPKSNPAWRERLISLRRQPSTVRIAKPTRIDRARSLGYQAKQGYVIIQQKVPRGGHKRPQLKGGRRPKRYRLKITLDKNYKQIAQERVQKKFTNLVLINSYYLAEDGKNYWYECILVDPDHPVIKSDKKINWVCTGKHKGRPHRGLNSN